MAQVSAHSQLRRLARLPVSFLACTACWLLLASDTAASPDQPVVTLHHNTNNVGGAPWRSSSTSVKYLGLYNSTAECEWACLR